MSGQRGKHCADKLAEPETGTKPARLSRRNRKADAKAKKAAENWKASTLVEDFTAPPIPAYDAETETGAVAGVIAEVAREDRERPPWPSNQDGWEPVRPASLDALYVPPAVRPGSVMVDEAGLAPPVNLARLDRVVPMAEHVRALPVGPVPPMPCSGVSAIWVDTIEYPSPAPGASVRCYAAALRHCGKATGTSTQYEHSAAWRLALEAGAAS